MSRRHCLQTLLRATGLCFVPFSKLFSQSPSSNGIGNYLPHYEDIAEKARLLYKTTLIGHETKDFLLSTTGGGVALFDYDNDGWLDLFLVNGWGLREFPKGEEPTNRLYRNNRDGTFTDVTEKARLVRHGWGQGVCVGDYDNDGNLDLFVTYFGRNVLYHNNGDGTFTDVTGQSCLLQPEERWNTGAAFLDYDRDGHLDLFVSNYVGHRHGLTLYESNPALAGEQSPVLYGVAGLEGTHNLLYHNNGDGTFSDVSRAAGITKPEPTYGFTPCVADFDNDGWPDIYVADDSTPSLLFLNNHDGTFKETGLLSGVAFDGNGRSQGGMGADAGDYDGDGRLDILKTNFSDETPSLYHNDGRAFFTDSTVQGGLAGQAASVKWGTAFFDFDNDGHPDFLIVTGPIYPPGINTRNSKLSQGSPMILCRNLGNGRFEDISARAGPDLLRLRCSRGAAFGDLFHTGQIDVVVNNINDRPTLLRNQSPSSNAWLLVQLVGTKTNRAAIGSRVVIETGKNRQIQEVRSGGSFCSQNDLRLHFGLGRASEVERMEVQWLSGSKDVLQGVRVNRLVTVQEGKGIIAQETF
jgi:enediyne biosynthesis protein E4